MSLSISKILIRAERLQYPKVLRIQYRKNKKHFEKKPKVKGSHKDKVIKINQNI